MKTTHNLNGYTNDPWTLYLFKVREGEKNIYAVLTLRGRKDFKKAIFKVIEKHIF